jgi:hypothetical protein
MPKRLYLDQFGPVHGLPVLHYRMEFAWLVRQAVQQLQPDCIAIELPSTLSEPFCRGVARLPQISALRYSLQKRGELEQTAWLLIEPADPLVEAARLALEQGIPLQLVDADTDSYPLHHEELPDPYAINRIGLAAYYHAYCERSDKPLPGRDDLIREQAMALHLQQLAGQYRRILFVCGMYHLERVKQAFTQPQAAPMARPRREGVSLFNLHPDSCREILGEFPFLSAIFEHRRSPLPVEPDDGTASLRKSFNLFELIQGGKQDSSPEQLLDNAIQRSARHSGAEGTFPDRQRIMLRLFTEAARHYRQETGEPVHHWQKRAFFRFTRNYALISNQLLPDLYQALTAARGCVDDNFAYAMLRLATRYPWQQDTAEIQTITISPEEIWGGVRSLRFRPREQRRKGLSQLEFLKRRKEKRAGEWLEGFDDPSICSYPPEDIAIEQYGAFLKKKGTLLRAEEQARVEPFSSSLLDGIDLRETLRNIHDGRVYVRETRRGKGDVGVVVMVFDEDRQNRAYPYMTTWLGEHNQESDMAFYATPPEENIVGPGICRCEYGGFMLSYPPRRLDDVWSDPDYDFARTKAELLLLAALDYSKERQVVYVAARPPRSIFRQIAGRIGRSIIYIPLGSLSPVTLKKLRVLHILHGRDKRTLAKEYIW